MAIGINFNSDWNKLMEEADLRRKARELKEVVIKPWGKYENVYLGSEYKVKVITVNPGHRLSDQRHRWRDEHWFITEGEAVLTANNKTVKLYRGMSADIERGVWHRVQNKQQIPLIFVEIQTGDCFEEDIDRRDDDYGRVEETNEECRARNKNFYEMYENGVEAKPYD